MEITAIKITNIPAATQIEAATLVEMTEVEEIMVQAAATPEEVTIIMEAGTLGPLDHQLAVGLRPNLITTQQVVEVIILADLAPSTDPRIQAEMVLTIILHLLKTITLAQETIGIPMIGEEIKSTTVKEMIRLIATSITLVEEVVVAMISLGIAITPLVAVDPKI